MTAPASALPVRQTPAADLLDSFSVGRHLRQLRKQHNLTLAQVSTATGMASSQLSMLENGKREAKVSQLHKLAQLYAVSLDTLTSGTPDRRTALEIELDRAMNSPLAQQRNLPQVRISPRMSTEVLEALVGLYREIEHQADQTAATPEEARRANVDLRAEMRARNNYFPELEAEAGKLLAKVDYHQGPLSQHAIGAITEHLGFTLHHVTDLPHSTRSVTDLDQMRIYLPQARNSDHDPRTVLLQALGHYVLGHRAPTNYGDFLRQRVETNYFAAALQMPESSTVLHLRTAKKNKQLAVEDLRDSFAVSYESAAHRMTNLLTHHLELPVHFLRVHESGTIYKAYENDGVCFPADHTGAIEGQPVCRFWTARQVFEVADQFNSFDSYTDTPSGTFWCTARVEHASGGDFATSLGVPYVHAKWFRGRITKYRDTSSCPDERCCRRPPERMARQWEKRAWPSARAHSHLLAALPPGAFPGVDEMAVYAFLEAHAED
ncbi:XRE family transcriptional regulator [Granulicoccus phenolivorans]|uniref:XRE family transcriptional regulator n=1 Tax=Granulicoccus phenolivorans TaxID=266854 RepID=UPI000419C79C|nr:XRE family transcriptional regulator [Granulicoccus phenolivorans]